MKKLKILAMVVIIAVILLFAPGFFLSKAVVNTTSNKESVQPITNNPTEKDTLIELAGQKMPVLKGGLFDRFHSNSPMDIVAKERPDIDLSWFKTIQKQKKEVGFTTYSPNFYYSNSSITAIYTADMAKIKELIPEKVKGLVKPISYTPGKGLIAITSYAYHYCDNDFYNELSISIVTTQPGKSNWGLISLMGELNDKNLWGYVLKLPVNTELARVRGVYGYNLPKWLIPIDYINEGNNLTFNYYDEKGNFDFSMAGKKLDVSASTPEITRSNFINLNKQGQLTHGYTDVRAIKKASSKSAEDIQLNLSDGPLSTFIKSLSLHKLVKYDYQPEFQAALYTPELVQEENK
ncbi:acetoacetate decarboxylase (ADC) [Chryseobacterium capnotolerans]|uniref:acetoacetate decarboxylase (ADC) n=1 Tax=Chryseobacterium TaxID=59732 RepID=UPI0009ED61C0|nr:MULTISPECIES: acetoacetate decarboxylase (ADC) [Chryseobacterium]UHO39693.1 acetoacetate decarboxylase (ADC) [Chryseobacterium capnotolerans]